MIATDKNTLKERLAELADAVGAKAPGDAGVKAWMIALRDFPIADAVDAIDQWLRTKSKMATPADIRALCANMASDRIEKKHAQDKEEFAEGSRRIVTEMSRNIARENLAKIRDILGGRTKKPRTETAEEFLSSL